MVCFESTTDRSRPSNTAQPYAFFIMQLISASSKSLAMLVESGRAKLLICATHLAPRNFSEGGQDKYFNSCTVSKNPRRGVLLMSLKRFFSLVALAAIFSNNAYSQEVCFTDAKVKFDKWRSENAAVLDDLSAKYTASADPSKEMIDYNGMKMPIAAALIIEGQKYGEKADIEVNNVVGSAQSCSKGTQIPRGVYDFAREILGITTILPERATRIDFEEIKRGNIAGGRHSAINETGRKIDEIFNPFRW